MGDKRQGGGGQKYQKRGDILFVRRLDSLPFYVNIKLKKNFAGSKWGGNNGPAGGPRTQPPSAPGPNSGGSGGGAPQTTTNKSR